MFSILLQLTSPPQIWIRFCISSHEYKFYLSSSHKSCSIITHFTACEAHCVWGQLWDIFYENCFEDIYIQQYVLVWLWKSTSMPCINISFSPVLRGGRQKKNQQKLKVLLNLNYNNMVFLMSTEIIGFGPWL